MPNKNDCFIEPVFTIDSGLQIIGSSLLEFTNDDYNKKIGAKLISASNDLEAISSFLNEYVDSPKTFRLYSKEIERLLLWCVHISKTNISSLKREQFIEYQGFLKSPEPTKIWCGPPVAKLKKNGEINTNWRPFVKGLGPSSIKVTLTILDSFFNYLVQTGYLEGNPLAIDKRRKKRHSSNQTIIDRYLELDEIHAVLHALSEHPASNDKDKFRVLRARYIILLFFYTGLRISEAANHCMGNFIQKEKNWFLRVTGKGNKIREIPTPDDLLDALTEYRLKMGMHSPYPEFKEQTPLISMSNLKQSISTRRIDQIVKWAFSLGAKLIEKTEPAKASKLRSASAHWLRHSYVTYLLNSGAPLKVAQENAGHSNVTTTIHYTHINQSDRHEATRNLSLLDKKPT